MANQRPVPERSEGDAVLDALRADPLVGVTIIRADGQILYANNRSASFYLGAPPERSVGHSIYELLPKEWADERMQILMQAHADSKPRVLRTMIRGVQSESTITPIADAGTPRFLVTSVTDGHTFERLEDGLIVIDSAFADLGPLDVLSARELEVLALLKQGLTNRQIARLLFRSPRTVENHIRSVSHKLGATNRVRLALIAQAAGLKMDGSVMKRMK